MRSFSTLHPIDEILYCINMENNRICQVQTHYSNDYAVFIRYFTIEEVPCHNGLISLLSVKYVIRSPSSSLTGYLLNLSNPKILSIRTSKISRIKR